jgi:hypothetical protein
MELLFYNSAIVLVCTKLMTTDTEIFREKQKIISPSKSKCLQLQF